MTSPQLLLVDDDPTFVDVLARAFSRRGFEVLRAHSVDEALQVSEGQPLSKAVVDLKMESSSGLDLITPLLEHHPDIDIVILTGYSSIATAVEAIKRGACNYLCKPAGADEILAAFDSPAQAPEPAIAEQPPSLERLEWEHIQKVLTANDGNVSATARQLGMHRRTLQRKLQKRPVRR